MSWIVALEAEIASKKSELNEILVLIEKSKSLMTEVTKLESILASATGTVPKAAKTSRAKAGGRTFTPEQKAAQALKMKESWAKKKAAKA